MSPAGGSGDWYDARPRRPGPSAPRTAGRRPFGTSWWGRAWVDALEQRAQLDPNRLPRGRSYARSGAVGTLTVAAGEITADVQGSRRAPYKVRVRVRPFSQEEWERVLDALAAEIGHTAALLDGELPPGVSDDVRSVGLDLLPGAGELQPRCSCPDWADPCKHAAAVCFLVADALDADPFGVLLLRGLGREEVLAGLRSRRHINVPVPPSVPSLEPEVDEGVLAKGAWARDAGPLPVAPLPPRRPGRPAVLAADPPPGSGVDLAALRALASDAAARALALARGGDSHCLELTEEEDLARRAALLLADKESNADSSAFGELARRAGLPGRELLRRALAFRDGGVEGLAVLDDAWEPDPVRLAAGRSLLGPAATARHNRVTLGERQLRLGRSGRWYPFRKDRGGWSPDGAPILPMVDDDDVGEVGDLPEAASSAKDGNRRLR
ncbi:MAG: SWIM zinc finger family protein [Acidimicrobiales bacterium]